MSPRPARAKSKSAFSRFTADDLYLFNSGEDFRAYEKFGAHPVTVDGVAGVYFAVFAPNAKSVAVIGSFNGWKGKQDRLAPRADSGIFEGFIPGVRVGDAYKFHLVSNYGGYQVDKTDPYGRLMEIAPRTASLVADLGYEWQDAEWMGSRAGRHRVDAPISIYEVHLGSWLRGEANRHLGYREIAPRLIEYVTRMGYTHVQFLPLLEHPYYGSWGYQVSGYFAPTSRYGKPQDLKFLIDSLHRAGIGVFLDWVPAHFPSDEAALGFFDGTYLYEHADPRKGFHPDWKSLIFNFGRPEVRSFLISSALFWLAEYHVDGLRVDAVASMLYLDYSRKEGEWIPNEHGGKENLEAIAFLRRFNEVVYHEYPGVTTIAEESTAWPMVSRPVYVGGLGFGLKWDMGWMHDSLAYFGADPVFRKNQHHQATFRQMYSDAENYVLALSHDEVVHGKGSLLRKMPGDEWRRFANLRLLLAWMFAQNGKKLLFMGCDLAAKSEWDHESQIDWSLLRQPPHRGVNELVAALNRLYRELPAMHRFDSDRRGFRWIDCTDVDQSVLAILRQCEDPEDDVAIVFNMTPVPRDAYRVGVPRPGIWRKLLDTDDPAFGGSGYERAVAFAAGGIERHGMPASIALSLPPLAAVFLKRDREDAGSRSASPDERR
jgi:1,4-alpha-glucan branching enzyme